MIETNPDTIEAQVSRKRVEELDEDRFYRALIERDASFEGLFFVGVITTGIFCRPTCAARKPRRENTRFFASPRDALIHGYRPCKVCRPTAPQGSFPDWLSPLMEELAADPDIRLRAADLRARGADPDRVRRWFKANHGITFHAYLRAVRIGRAYGRIIQGDSVTDAAFDSGYESLSGFTHSFKRNTGFAPKHSAERHMITVGRIATPLGPMLAGVTDERICLLEFVDRRMIEKQIESLRRLLNASVLPGTTPVLSSLRRQLDAYFAGELQNFDLPLVVPGTEFQQLVWRELCTIPYGETRSYRQQATRIGRPDAVRAVARANGDNRIAIVIPCHRVIGTDGSLTGYGGGLARKRFLLDLERARSHRN